MPPSPLRFPPPTWSIFHAEYFWYFWMKYKFRPEIQMGKCTWLSTAYCSNSSCWMDSQSILIVKTNWLPRNAEIGQAPRSPGCQVTGTESVPRPGGPGADLPWPHSGAVPTAPSCLLHFTFRRMKTSEKSHYYLVVQICWETYKAKCINAGGRLYSVCSLA